MEPDEIRRLLEVTRMEPTRWRMTGPERAWLFQLAAESGLRSNEIRSLKVNSFDFDKCTRASHSKRKRERYLALKTGYSGGATEAFFRQATGCPGIQNAQ